MVYITGAIIKKQMMFQIRGSYGKTLVVALFYLVAAVLLSWPLMLHLDGFLLSEQFKDISRSDTLDHIDLMLGAVREFREGRVFWVAKPGHELSNTYVLFGVFSILLGVKAIVYHNLYFLSCIFLSGLFMYLLMFELCRDRIASFFAGFLYMSSNYLFHQYMWGHTHVMPIQWIPLIFYLLEKCLATENLRYPLFLGIVLSTQILSSTQYTVYLSFIAPIYLMLRVAFGAKVDGKRFMSWMVISASIAFLLSWNYILMKTSAPTSRTIEENMQPYWRMYSLEQLFDVSENIHLGLTQFLLTLSGACIIFLNIRNEVYRKYVPIIFLFVFLVFSMMGPFSIISAPYFWLYKTWPFVSSFRVPRRLFPFVLMCSSIISSVFLLRLKEMGGLKKYRVHMLFILVNVIVFSQIVVSPWLTGHHIFYP